jgi:hypothetical protein
MESKTPTFIFPNFPKENNLDIDKLLYWLNTNSSSNGKVTLAYEVKCFLYGKIISGELIYGQIPAEYVLPYLKITPKITKFIKSNNTRDLKLPRNGNLAFLASKFASIDLTDIVSPFFKYKQFGEDYFEEYKYINIGNCDDFPLIHIAKDNITYSPLCYGVVNPYSWLNILSLYGLSRERYIAYYNNLSPTLGYDIVDNGLYSEAIFSDSGYGVSRIINLPALATKLKTHRTTPLQNILSFGAHYKILKNISDPKLKTFLEITNLNIDFPSLYTRDDSIPPSTIIDYLNGPTIYRIVESFSDAKQYMRDNWRMICESSPVKDWLEDTVSMFSSKPQLMFNCALRKFKPSPTSSDGIMYVICNMLDYGLPGTDINSANIRVRYY